MKRIICIIIVAIMTFSMVACGKENKIDETKTQLYVGVFDGGFGSGWLTSIKPHFEELYKDVSFGEGKLGVELRILPSRKVSGTNVADLIGGWQEEVIFTEAVNYSQLSERGMLKEITDVVTGSMQHDFVLNETFDKRENTTIATKMRKELKDYYNINGSYYAIPFYESTYGIIYDVDLFAEKNWFFAKPGQGDDDGFILSKTAERSAGPDKDYNTTTDNGLPATYDDFFKLCKRIDYDNCVPLVWSDNYLYGTAVMNSMEADYLGLEQAMIKYTLNGTATKIVDKIENGVVTTKSVDITTDNGYINYQNAGKYHAMDFFQRIIDGNYYSEYTFKDTTTHLDAQAYFANSRFDRRAQPIAMLLDGSWWQLEATGAFNDIIDPEGRADKRNFAFMPIPKVSANEPGTASFLEANITSCFINNSIADSKLNLAKAFLQYCHTNAAIVDFAIQTNACKPYEFMMTDPEYNQLTSWGKNNYNIHKNAVIISPYAQNSTYAKSQIHFVDSMYLWKSTIDGKTYEKPIAAMFDTRNESSRITPTKYFEGLKNFYTSTMWKREVYKK